MKGDGKIKKYKIRFLNVGYNDSYQVKLKIYDSNNKLVFSGTTYNGEITILLKKNKVYRLEAYFLNEKICTSFYTSNEYNLLFFFNHSIINQPDITIHTVTFLLTDYYYNLPIEKGEILLWQR